MTKLTDQDWGKFKSLIYKDDRLYRAVDQTIECHFKDFEAVCESPIEILLGSAFTMLESMLHSARTRVQLVYLNDPDRSRKPLLPAQLELIAQFPWEGYRIDFAIFAGFLTYPIFIECDGHDFHERTKEQAAHDREKDRKIQKAGIPILRFTGSQIYADPVSCAHEIHEFIVARLREETEGAKTG